MVGNTGDLYPFFSARIPAWLAWFDTPDEPGPFPAYEPTIMRIYARCGWAFTVWWNLSLRNVAHGFLHRFSQPWPADALVMPTNAALRQTKWGIGYGWKAYRDWRREVHAPHGAVAPAYYLVPSFFNKEK